jgi:hypothetical protein
MRFEFDNEKSRSVKRKHGVSLKEAQDIFDQRTSSTRRMTIRNNFAPSVGPVVGAVPSFSRFGTMPGANTITSSRLGRQRRKKSKAMPKTSRKNPTTAKTPTADEIAEMASRGEDISSYFTRKFTVVRPIHRVNVDLTQGMLRKLDERAARLNISRQAVIKTLLEQALSEEQAHKRRSQKAG